MYHCKKICREEVVIGEELEPCRQKERREEERIGVACINK